MEKDLAKVTWDDGMSFTTETDGFKQVIDSHPDFGGRGLGPKPKPFLLTALGGCTAMDVISMLNKMRVKYDSFNVNVEGSLSEEHPKYYNKIHIIYEVVGEDIPVDKIQKAVDLSEERYCGVSFMLRKAAEITNEIQINGKKI